MLAGNSAANHLSGNAGNDNLYGADGDDTLVGGTGSDLLEGGAGTDTADYSAQSSAVTAELWRGMAVNDGSASIDYLANIEHVLGGSGNDLLAGNSAANHLSGNAGNDNLYGADDGDDTLEGGVGGDVLNGGAGADVFYFSTGSGVDYVQDFSVAGGDKIRLLTNVNGSGIIDGASALAHTANNGSGYATIDLGGGNTITLVGVSTASLSAADFIFV